MKCEQCFHYEMCLQAQAIEKTHTCRHFKDKTLIVELPCKYGERWKDKWGDIFVVVGFHFDQWDGWSVLYRAENEAKNGDDLLAVNFVYWTKNLTHEAAEQALERKGVE